MSGALLSKAETWCGRGLDKYREGMYTLGEEDEVEFKALVCGCRPGSSLARWCRLPMRIDCRDVSRGDARWTAREYDGTTVADKQGQYRPVPHVDVILENALNCASDLPLLACPTSPDSPPSPPTKVFPPFACPCAAQTVVSAIAQPRYPTAPAVIPARRQVGALYLAFVRPPQHPLADRKSCSCCWPSGREAYQSRVFPSKPMVATNTQTRYVCPAG
jgi:hypothetical protein